MKETQRKYYLSALEISQNEFNHKVDNLGEKIRTEVIIPVCKKYNLAFIPIWLTELAETFYPDEGEV